MQNLDKKIFTFDEFAALLMQHLDDKDFIICITGPSCIGKSTLANKIMEGLQEKNVVQILCADDYLKDEYKGDTRFRKNSERLLKPDAYDWELMSEHVVALQHGRSIVTDTYIRGIGWGHKRTLQPSTHLIIEGLFLDSKEFPNRMPIDLWVEMSAEDQVIIKSRLQRDAYYRKTFQHFNRNQKESVQEVHNTIQAYKLYQRVEIKFPYLKVSIDKNHLITVLMSNIT